MGGWRASASLLLNHASRRRPRTTLVNNPSFLLIFGPSAAYSSSCTPCRRPPQGICSSFWVRPFSGYPSRVPAYASDNESGCHDSAQNFPMELKEDESDLGKILVKAYFLSTSIDLKNMQGENLINVVPPTSRSTNYIVLKYYDYQPEITALGIKESLSTRYMVVFQYGSAVLINIEDHEVESYLDLVRRHASGLLPEMRKDDYAIKEKPRLINDMQGGPDYIVLRSLDTDSIRIIGSVLGQSIALDYFVSQVDGMVEEFAGINRGMEKTGTFIMDRTTLIKLVGKANSNLADVILKVGLFERSEIAWKDAKYAQIYEYLRDEYEVNQRFGSLDFKLKFVEHNIHFLQEVIQNRRSDLLEWQMAVSEAQEMRNFEASPTIFVTLMQQRTN